MKKKTKKVNVNLGCGTNLIKGWVNIDTHVPQHNSAADLEYFVKGDVMQIPLESNSVYYLICDQVLEHVPMADVPTVLYEIRRVLKKGGRAVICVPDFKGAVEQWLSFDHDRFFNPLTFKYLSEVIYGSQEHEGQFHRSPMTAGFLHYALNMVGLTKHELVMYVAGAPVPTYPGMVPPASSEVRCRNAQLIADIKKI
jgi:predicted SAM-dependent methyltransferase